MSSQQTDYVRQGRALGLDVGTPVQGEEPPLFSGGAPSTTTSTRNSKRQQQVQQQQQQQQQQDNSFDDDDDDDSELDDGSDDEDGSDDDGSGSGSSSSQPKKTSPTTGRGKGAPKKPVNSKAASTKTGGGGKKKLSRQEQQRLASKRYRAKRKDVVDQLRAEVEQYKIHREEKKDSHFAIVTRLAEAQAQNQQLKSSLVEGAVMEPPVYKNVRPASSWEMSHQLLLEELVKDSVAALALYDSGTDPKKAAAALAKVDAPNFRKVLVDELVDFAREDRFDRRIMPPVSIGISHAVGVPIRPGGAEAPTSAPDAHVRAVIIFQLFRDALANCRDPFNPKQIAAFEAAKEAETDLREMIDQRAAEKIATGQLLGSTMSVAEHLDLMRLMEEIRQRLEEERDHFADLITTGVNCLSSVQFAHMMVYLDFRKQVFQSWLAMWNDMDTPQGSSAGRV